MSLWMTRTLYLHLLRAVFLLPTFISISTSWIFFVRNSSQLTLSKALNTYFTGMPFFLHGLIMALCYTAVQDQRGQKAYFYFFSVPAQAMPYCMLGASLLMSPEIIPLQVTGIVAAHLHDFLTRIYPEFSGGPNLLPTPAFMSRLVQTPRLLQRTYGTAIRPTAAAEPSTGRTTGASGPVLPESWRSRGSGHRLGGD
jgi:Derlin-2/3